MNILEDHNEWEPKEITLDYKVYKDLLNKVADYPKIMKQLTEEGSHILLKHQSHDKIVYALVPKKDFDSIKNKFN